MTSSNTLARCAWLFFALAFCVIALGAPGCKKRQVKEPPRPPIHAPDRPVQQDPVNRGKMIFSGTEYSATGLSCANCHAVSANPARIFIAHSASGTLARGAWWIMTQAELDAKQGEAATFAEAANKCVSAPYMGGQKLIAGDDAKALEAFYQSISDPAAKDSAPFIQTPPKALPPKGLKPDPANGKRIYEASCSRCHGAIKGIVDLQDANTWLNEVQVMAKVRHLPNWEDGNKDAKYASYPGRLMRLAQACGLRLAFAQAPGAGADAAAGGDSEQEIFPEKAMPYFASDILSDQDVVDVAFYVIKDLPKEIASQEQPAGAPAK